METVLIEGWDTLITSVAAIQSLVSALLGMTCWLCGVELWRVVVRACSSRDVL